MEAIIQENYQQEEISILKFNVGGHSYGLNLSHVNEIVKHCESTNVPNASPNIEGIIVQRNTVITIVNLGKLMNAGLISSRAERIIIIEYNNNLIGLHVEKVLGIFKGKLSDTIIQGEKNNPSNLKLDINLEKDEKFIQGYVMDTNQQLAVLDIEKIIKQSISEIV